MAVGGRNRKVAEAFALNGGKRFDFLSFVHSTWMQLFTNHPELDG